MRFPGTLPHHDKLNFHLSGALRRPHHALDQLNVKKKWPQLHFLLSVELCFLVAPPPQNPTTTQSVAICAPYNTIGHVNY